MTRPKRPVSYTIYYQGSIFGSVPALSDYEYVLNSIWSIQQFSTNINTRLVVALLSVAGFVIM